MLRIRCKCGSCVLFEYAKCGELDVNVVAVFCLSMQNVEN